MQETMERERLVRLLLESRDDYLPPVRVVELASQPGPAASRRVPCDACKQLGRVLVGRGKSRTERYCSVCEGYGWRLKRPDDVEWCEYVEAPLAEAAPRGMEKGKGPSPDQPDERFVWERERLRYWRAGSYAELDRALRRLRAKDIAAYRAVTLLYTSGLRVTITEALRGRERAAVAFLAREMRGHIRVPSWLSYERSRSQTPSIVELHQAGKTAGQIAKMLGLRKEKVRRMLRGIHAVR